MNVLSAKAGEHDACFALMKDGEAVFVYVAVISGGDRLADTL